MRGGGLFSGNLLGRVYWENRGRGAYHRENGIGVIGEGLVLRGLINQSAYGGDALWGSGTMTHFPLRFLRVLEGGAAISFQ